MTGQLLRLLALSFGRGRKNNFFCSVKQARLARTYREDELSNEGISSRLWEGRRQARSFLKLLRRLRRQGIRSGGTDTECLNIFYRLANSGDALPESGTTDHFPKAVMINERPEIVFCAVDSEGAKGYYRLSMDFSGKRPQIVSSHKVVRVGDMLADSLSVVKIHNVDLNDAGTFAAILATNDNLSGIYLARQGSGLEPTVRANDSTPEVEASFGSRFLDVDIHDNDNMMFVSHYAYKTKGGSGQGLFHLPGGELGARGDLLLSTGEDIPEATGVVNGLGLIDMHDDGNYVLQAFGHDSGNVSATAKRQGQPATMLIKGNVREPLSRTLRGLSPSIMVGKSAAARLGFSYGEMNYGPRIGIGGRIASVHQIGEHDLVLMYEGVQIASTRGASPLGNIITGLGAPVIGEDSIVYYQTYHDLSPGAGFTNLSPSTENNTGRSSPRATL